jgi:Ca2+-binding RTX toxin-like protein
MATNVLTAGNDLVTITQGSSASFWGKSYDGGAGVDTLNVTDSYSAYAGNFSLTCNIAGVLTLSTGSGSVTFTNFEVIKFATTTINLGTAGNDTITGGAKVDTFLFGLGGNDTIDGGASADTVVMMGARANYTVTAVGANYQIVDNTGADGTDQLISIENVKFTDGTFAIASLVTVAGPPAIINGTTGNDTLTGNAINNTINGLAGDDTLIASGGTDTLVGGAGNDTYVVTSTADVIVENANEGTDTVQSSVSYSIAALANVENLTLTGAGGNSATGNSGANVIIGNSGNNTLTGGAGNDTINGGGGADTAVFSGNKASYTVTTTDGISGTITGPDGTDQLINITTLQFADTSATMLSYKPVAGPLTINGTAGNDTLAGTAAAEIINGLAGNDILTGSGNDTLVGGANNDTYIVSSTTDTITELLNDGTDTVQSSVTYSIASLSNVENITLTGGSMINATGNAGANVLIGNASNNSLTGGAGNDTLTGGGGTDTAVFSGNKALYTVTTSDGISGTVTGPDGTDTLTNITNLQFADTSATLASYLPAPPSVINGTAGNDTALNGTNANDTVNGLAGNDTINGLGGFDVLNGGTGDDTYIVDTATDTINENLNEGNDTVQSSVTQTVLAANVENLTLTGTGAINGSGNGLANTITGNSGNNILTGGAGNDQIIGGGGSDTAVFSGNKASYTVTTTDGISGTITGADGTDTLTNITSLQFADTTVTFLSYKPGTVPGPINGTSGADTLNGTTGNDVFNGGLGNDVINGGGGVDTAVFSGNKALYTVTTTDGISGTITGPDGTDTLNNITSLQFADITSSMMSFKPVVSGNTPTAGADNLTGTAGNDTIDGLGGNDTINGGLGNDMLTGGLGNDAIIGGGGSDTAVYSGNKAAYTVYTADGVSGSISGADGTDTLTDITSLEFADGTFSFLSFKPTGGGTGGVTGTSGPDALSGTAGADTMKGLAGNDVLNGLAGADVMIGGTGNDTYYVENIGDIVREVVNQGTDTIISSITISALKANVENVKLLGTGSLKLVGNSLNNVITGNAGNNVLSGMGGNDKIIGGKGHDTMTGGAGKDVFDFNSTLESKVGSTRDVITDFTHGVDKIDMSTIDANNHHTGNDRFIMQSIKGVVFTGYEGQMHYSWVGSNTVVECDYNGDRKADMQILLTGHHTLTASDFIL